MAWAPSITFEDELVDMQSDFNFVYGQRAYEIKRQQESASASDPRPKSAYEYLAKREKRNEELERLYGSSSSKSREIRSSLAMMERIQKISGTKSLGEHATMTDWDDTSTIEREAIAMMRHFGMMSMAEDTVSALTSSKTEDIPNDKKKVQVVHNGRRTFPIIVDSEYFIPRKTRPASDGTSSTSNSSFGSFDINQTSSDHSMVFFSAQSHLDTSKSSQEEDVDDIPYQLLVEGIPTEFGSELKAQQINEKVAEDSF